ncbi:hypothetical protein FRC11_001074, partial [Ceratobasidium sp. 423]
HLCEEFNLSVEGKQLDLAMRLVNHNKNHPLPTMAADGLDLASAVAVLGHEVMSEIQEDMHNTIIPGW